MKKLIAVTVLAFLFTSAAFAADPQENMAQGEMMQNCQNHMKDGKMMDAMPKDMMMQCQKMMKDHGMMKDGMMNGGMMQKDGMPDASTSSKSSDGADHQAHHSQP